MVRLFMWWFFRGWTKVLIRDAALLVTIVVVVGVPLRQTSLLDRLFVYFPDTEIFQTPADRGLEFEDVFLDTSDGVRLHGWYVPGSTDLTWVWFHGNAGNIANRVDNLAAIHERLGANVFLIDYRGYGRSEGNPSEQGFYRDAEAAVQYLTSHKGLDERKFVLFGRSLGCAVAAETAMRHGAYAVILESPFTSIQAMARRVYPFLPGAGLLVRARYDSLSKIGNVRAPVMVLHGDADDIAPFDMGREVFDAANEPKRFHAIEGAGHNDTYVVGGEDYWDALASFLADPAGGGG